MALQNLLDLSQKRNKIGISQERIEAIKPALRQYIAFWREYPDMFIDFLQTGGNGEVPKDGLRFYFYQRVFLRVAVRYRRVYAVFPRGYDECPKNFIKIWTNFSNCGNPKFKYL